MEAPIHSDDSAMAEESARCSALDLLLNALNVLTSPASFKPQLSEGTPELLDSVLLCNFECFRRHLTESQRLQQELGAYSVLLTIHDVRSSILNGSDVSVRQEVSDALICLLLCLSNKLANSAGADAGGHGEVEEAKSATNVAGSGLDASKNVPSLSPCVLSVQQEKTISAALQFVVVLGISPYLYPGVGVPISQRLGPGQILLATAHDFSTELTDQNRIQCLSPVIKLFWTMLNVPSLKNIVLSSYLGDLLAALIQIRHCSKVIMQEFKQQSQIKSVQCCPATSLRQSDSSPLEDRHMKKPLAQLHQPAAECLAHPSSISSDTSATTAGAVLPSTSLTEGTDNLYVYVIKELPDMYLDARSQPWTFPSVIEHCNREIDRALRSTNTAHVLTVLMMLSGGVKSSIGVPVKTPLWFKRTVAGMLRDIIMVPPGLHHLIALFIGESSSSNASTQEWQKCKALAQIISRCPVTPNNIEQFYSSVSQQLISLIHASQEKVSPLVIRAVGEAIQELTNQQPNLMQRVCLSHLLAPLLKLSLNKDEGHPSVENTVVLSEETIRSCLVCLHRLFVIGQEPQSTIVSALREVTGILFSVFFFTRSGVSTQKSLCKELIQAYLKHCSVEEAVTCLMCLLLSDSDKSQMYPPVHRDVAFVSGAEGGMQAIVCREKQENLDSWTQQVDAVTDILCDLNSKPVTSQLFLCLLQKLTDIVTSETAKTDIVLPSRVFSPAQQTIQMAELKEKILLVTLLAAIGEKFGDQVIDSGQHVLAFAKATLERCVKICQSCNDDVTQAFEWETVSMAMGLLTAVLGGAVELTDEDKKLLDELLPLLTAISESDGADPAVKEMADDLKVAVATRGLVHVELSKFKAEQKVQENKKPEGKSTQQAKPLIQVLSETSAEEDSQNSNDGEKMEKLYSSDDYSKMASKNAETSSLRQAFQELCDPLLPVRGHGLISLARMAEERSEEVKEKLDMLLKVFMENLTHTDSYIYLAAVNGLAALSDLCPDKVIPCLTSEFRSKCTKDQTSKSGETTLKIGEAVVKATKRLGELTPKYRDQLLPAMLCGCCHSDAFVRTSSLSGLADICKLLRFSIGPVLHEVLTCCRDVMTSDPEPAPRQAATLTLSLLIQGLGKDTLLALGDVLLDIYRVLKHSLNFDPDEKVKFHANLALGELDDVMREALFAKPELKKTITILGYQ